MLTELDETSESEVGDFQQTLFFISILLVKHKITFGNSKVSQFFVYKWSKSPSKTASVFPVSNSVRKSFDHVIRMQYVERIWFPHPGVL